MWRQDKSKDIKYVIISEQQNTMLKRHPPTKE